MLKVLIILTISAILFAFMPISPVYACKCATSFQPDPLQILKSFGKVDAVFIGKVVDTKLEREKENFEAKIDIIKRYKYPGGLAQIEIATNDPNDTICGYPFEKGREYLVYAYETKSGNWRTDVCTRTGKLVDKSSDVDFLNKLKAFNDMAFNTYKLIGIPALLPIPHKSPPEVWGPAGDTDPLMHSEGLIRNPVWFEGWKVFTNLLIWTVVFIALLSLVIKFFVSRPKKKKK